ncbi:nucleolar protein 4-like [Physella acuta]|uniref:nucleolar protein 4-like n=1 Tax=Physella acuta TaxID=109671 RepID=UPI0027DE6769|nr:nucleolar protein 4-like [Physella acuta]
MTAFMDSPADGESQNSFKKVAVVENFFQIIYSVHVEMDGRGGKHAGQKRTYRAIAEMYSFLPREAVTRFLMSCTDCQKRMNLSLESNNNLSSAEDRNSQQEDIFISVTSQSGAARTTSHNGGRLSGKSSASPEIERDEESVSSESIMSRESPSLREEGRAEVPEEKEMTPDPVATASTTTTTTTAAIINTIINSAIINSTTANSTADASPEPPADDSMTSARRASPQPMEAENRVDSPLEEVSSRKTSPVPGKIPEVSKGHPERKRRASSESGDSAMTKTSEGKDDDDDDDNDDDEKIPVGQDIDPERLKAFNMFVRLFVDENLDRMVPISKQPKDKIQAILEACDRQFPEFHERSRKRIRTYLKSCRRMRRSKEHNGWEPLRPTPPHLTSAAAESLLATACENESQNAKRMRLGLEPLPASAMVAHNALVSAQTPPSTQASTPQQPPTAVTPSQPSSISSPRSLNNCSANTDFLRHQPPPPTFRPAPDFPPSFFTNGHGGALFRPGFPSYQHPAHHHPSVLPHAPISTNATTNGEFGPTDLSMKKSSTKGQLSSSEVTAIKQLIAGYRESAAFLYRSADELEQLLLQQN